MANGVEIKTTVSGSGYTYFEIVGDAQEYTLLSFSLCHEAGDGRSEMIDVWEDDGNIETFTKSNAQQGGRSYPIR
jgi:hypothetical protein